MSHWVIREDYYGGSRLLQPVSGAMGIQIDKFNYIVAGMASILIGTFYRKVLHPSRVTVLARKLFTIFVGISIMYFCFGTDIKHLFIQSLISYILMHVVDIEVLPRATLFFTLGYQSILHALRMYYDYEGYTLDITGALMMLTQRLTSLAFSLRDGQRPEGCQPYMLKDAIKVKPDLLTYMTYAFDFHMTLCGPLVPFKEFERVTEGTVFDESCKEKNNNSKIKRSEPDPTPFVIKRFIFCMGCLLMVFFVVPHFKIEFLLTDGFHQANLFTRLFWIFIYTALTRQQYYTIWKMAECICNSSNYGYRYVKGEHLWDGCTNVRILDVETCLSQRDGLAAWNTSTQRWLRSICYDRVPTNKTMMTFFLSAAWHGFYPGYYFTFMTLAVQTLAARSVRRSIRPYFQGSVVTRKLWDLISFFVTLLGFAYATLPFILLSFNKSIFVWSQVYFYGHIFSAFAIFVLPKLVPPQRASTKVE